MKKNFNLISIILLMLFLVIDSYIGTQILESNPSFLEYVIISAITALPFIGILMFVDKKIKKH